MIAHPVCPRAFTESIYPIYVCTTNDQDCRMQPSPVMIALGVCAAAPAEWRIGGSG